MGSGGGIVRLGQLHVSLVDGGCMDELAATSLSELTAPTDGKDSERRLLINKRATLCRTRSKQPGGAASVSQ